MIRIVMRLVLALFYAAAGAIHLANPAPFLSIMPPWVPQPEAVVALTGVAELGGAAGLLQPWSPALRRAAGWGLALYALCVWPANVQHMLNDDGRNLAYHIPRLAFQPVLIWLALWVSHVTDWPRRGSAAKGGA